MSDWTNLKNYNMHRKLNIYSITLTEKYRLQSYIHFGSERFQCLSLLCSPNRPKQIFRLKGWLWSRKKLESNLWTAKKEGLSLLSTTTNLLTLIINESANFELGRLVHPHQPASQIIPPPSPFNISRCFHLFPHSWKFRISTSMHSLNTPYSSLDKLKVKPESTVWQ